MPRQALLVVSAGIAHPSLVARSFFRTAIAAAAARARLRPMFRHSTGSFRELEDVHPAAVAIFFHRKGIRAGELAALEEYVEDGGGLFAVHGCVASFKTEGRWGALLGGVFAGHGAVDDVDVRPEADAREFAGLCPFMVRDELYRIGVASTIEVRMAGALRGLREPVVWTHRHGKGRVCCCTLGHTAASLRSDGVKEIIARGLAWTTQGQLAARTSRAQASGAAGHER